MNTRNLPVLLLTCLLLAIHPAAAGQVTMDFPVVQDTWVNLARPTRNYGSQTLMDIRDGDRKIVYLQVQAFGITGAVQSATLYFRLTGDTGIVDAYKVNDQTWDEGTMTYDTKPAWNATKVGSTTSGSGLRSLSVAPVITGNGLYTFALRSANLNGSINARDSSTVSYRPYVRVVYEEVNQAPVGQPENYNVLANTLRTVEAPGVLANDSDPNGDAITAQLATAPAHGTLVLAANGSFTYLPASGFEGTDTFTYRAVDANPLGAQVSAPITVTLNVLGAGTPQFTAYELARFQQDLGVTLSVDEQLELAAIVKPATSQTWRTQANARINANRMADLTVTVLDANGQPLQGASVDVELLRKAFHFGGVLDLPEFMNGISGGLSSTAYRDLALKYFDAVGLNNALKPKQSMYGTFNNGNLTNLENSFFPWCAANNIPARGHLLLWPGGTFMSAPVEAKVEEIEGTDVPTQTQLDELRALVDNEVATWAGMWNVYEWDVVNEVLGNHRIQDILGPNEIVRWFQLAQSASTNAGRPSTGRLINEYQIISGNGEGRIGPYKSQIQYLIDNNAPITGIGFQSRFKYRREDPALLYSRLEQFAGYNKDLVGTEFEVIPNPDGSFTPSEALRAQMTEEIMTTYFSHPKVTGFFAWEFAHSEERALVTHSGAAKLNGLVWYYLNRLRYDTRASLVTDSLGRVSLRGYKGDYRINVAIDGSPVTRNVTLSADSQIQIGTSVVTSETRTLDVVADTHAYQTNPATNYANSLNLQTRSITGAAARVSYLKFDLSTVTAEVLSAKLLLHVTTGSTMPMQVLAVADTTWLENTLNWNNRPATGAMIGNIASTPQATVIEIPLDAASIQTGGMFSVALSETNDLYRAFASAENNTSLPVPRLVLVTGTPDTDGDGVLDTLDHDDDNDGLPDDWETANGMDPLASGDAAIDHDHDGFNAFAEFALALDPHAANTRGEVMDVAAVSPTSVRITLRRRVHGMLDVLLQHSADLGPIWDSTSPASPEIPGYAVLQSNSIIQSDAFGPYETYTVTLESTAPAGFFRLMLQQP